MGASQGAARKQRGNYMANEFKTIARDPFARTETVRRRLPCDSECSWCGNVARFEYGTETDGGRRFTDGKYFCSASCRRDYYNG